MTAHRDLDGSIDDVGHTGAHAPEPPQLTGTWADVMAAPAELASAIEQWLPHRRWYAGKEHDPRSVTVENTVLLDADDAVVLLVVRTAFDDDADHRYAIPVLRSTGSAAATARAERPEAVLARLADGALVIDALTGADGAAVVRAALNEQTYAGRAGDARGRPRRADLARLAGSEHDVRPLGVEQSNSSVLVGDRLIAKLVRRLDSGANPDVELPAHLSAQGFTQVPGVAATLEVDLVGAHEPADVVLVHDAIANDGDLWSWVLAELRSALDRDGGFESARDRTMTLAQLLGRRTAELHAALAFSVGDDGFAPRPFTIEWQRTLLQTLGDEVTATQRALRRAGHDTAPARTLLAPVDEVLTRFEPLRDTPLDAHRIRIHGDLHLGQILRTGDDITFIDFEGEPGQPMAERRVMRSPLADLAGLLRSVDYAGRMALDRAVADGVVTDAGHRDTDRDRAAWNRAVSTVLTDTYLDTAHTTGLVPTDRADAERLLGVYLLQKGLYEIRYELANRPTWVHWPLSAVAEMVGPEQRPIAPPEPTETTS